MPRKKQNQSIGTSKTKRKLVTNGGILCRSAFEVGFINDLEYRGVPFEYEALVINYTLNKKGKYHPDIVLPNGIIVEAKGWFREDALKKMKAVKESNPDLDIRIVFQRADEPIRKGAKMTYGQWADKYGFPWASRVIPQEWIDEAPKCESLNQKMKKNG